MDASKNSFWKSFGPGILFAGAAIGNSHLVQSTRAGALYGLGLFVLVIAANFIKYPAFRFGPQYAAATGHSILSGYRKLGKWVIALFAMSELFVMTIIIAASAITTAAVALAIFESDITSRYLAVALVLIGAMVLRIGGYTFLDRLTKVFVAILTVTTLLATALAIPSANWGISEFALPDMDFKTFAFIIALMGFMPAALSLGVLQSLWVIAKSEQTGVEIDKSGVMLDFNFGYIASGFLAICFLIMGAGVLHPEGIVPATSGAAFAEQVIMLYTNSLGEWSGFLVGISAMMVMFTTLVTLLDGFPRTLAASAFYYISDGKTRPPKLGGSKYMAAATLFIVVGASLILLLLMKNFRDFIDFVTITAFIVAPFTAIINHIVITRADISKGDQPGLWLRIWSLAGIASLSLLSVAYMYQLFNQV